VVGHGSVSREFDEGGRADPRLKMHLRKPDRVEAEILGECDPAVIGFSLIRALDPAKREAESGLF
jgi:hypothetical protein